MTASTVYLLKGLSDEQKAYVMSQLATKEKDTSMAYLCWFFGIHYFYLGEPLKNVLYLLTSLTIIGIIIWAIIDLFRMKSIVEEANTKIIQELIMESKLIINSEK